MLTMVSFSTINDTWARSDYIGNPIDLDMKRKLRKGDYKTLNLYFLSDYLSGPTRALGYCTLPESPPSILADGCSIDSTTMPGGSNQVANLGYTATHETGHWLGLDHVFNGGTCADGDSIADTPFQSEPTYGCPVDPSTGATTKDSCPSDPGLDSIHNYMDYSDDPCMNEFTAGQKAAMSGAWARFRAKSGL
jgi:hypothetical protein